MFLLRDTPKRPRASRRAAMCGGPPSQPSAYSEGAPNEATSGAPQGAPRGPPGGPPGACSTGGEKKIDIKEAGRERKELEALEVSLGAPEACEGPLYVSVQRLPPLQQQQRRQQEAPVFSEGDRQKLTAVCS